MSLAYYLVNLSSSLINLILPLSFFIYFSGVNFTDLLTVDFDTKDDTDFFAEPMLFLGADWCGDLDLDLEYLESDMREALLLFFIRIDFWAVPFDSSVGDSGH